MKTYFVIAVMFSVISVLLLVGAIRKNWDKAFMKALLFSGLLAVSGWILVAISYFFKL